MHLEDVDSAPKQSLLQMGHLTPIVCQIIMPLDCLHEK